MTYNTQPSNSADERTKRPANNYTDVGERCGQHTQARTHAMMVSSAGVCSVALLAIATIVLAQSGQTDAQRNRGGEFECVLGWEFAKDTTLFASHGQLNPARNNRLLCLDIA